MSANLCALCGRRWTDEDCPHGVEGLVRVGGVGWVPAEVAIAPMDVEWVAIPTGDFGSPGRSHDRRVATERGWAE